jgi:hypothetical protein
MKPDKPKKDEEVVLTLDDIEEFESPEPILPKDDDDDDASLDEE